MEKIINWLLEDSNPSVKYFTRKNILHEKIDSEEFSLILKDITCSEPVKSILSLQNKEGWWSVNRYSFNPLYKNTFWQLYFLSLLGVKKSVDGIDTAVRLVIGNMQAKNGSFPQSFKYSGSLPCMQGIALEILLRLGYENSDFTEKTIKFINDLVYRDDFRCKYRQNLRCPWGTTKILKAFNLIPKNNRNKKMKETINKAVNFLLNHNIVKANYPRRNKISKHWFMFGFPRSYQSDILEVTSAIVGVGCNKKSTNIRSALDYISSKKLEDGTWKMEFSLNGRMLVDIEVSHKPSKWVTCNALKTLLECNYGSI